MYLTEESVRLQLDMTVMVNSREKASQSQKEEAVGIWEQAGEGSPPGVDQRRLAERGGYPGTRHPRGGRLSWAAGATCQTHQESTAPLPAIEFTWVGVCVREWYVRA